MSTTLVHRRSALEAFNCPRRYKALYIDHVPDTSDPARRGQAFHAAAHRYIDELYRRKKTDDYELAAACLKQAIAETITPAHLLTDVSALFWTWAETFELDLESLLVVEERQISAKGYAWTPDLVYARGDTIELRDWKTHYAAFTETQARQEFQARWYVWQARHLWPGFQTYRIVFVFVRWGWEVSVEFDQGSIDQMDTQVESIIAAIDHATAVEEWPAVPGDHCAFCSVTCPLVDHPERVEVRLVTRADAQRIGGLKLALDRASKLAGDALAGWCAANGPLEVGGMEFAHRPTATTSFPIREVWRVLTDQGVQPSFSVSRSALKSYLSAKKFSHVREPLEALAVVKPSTRFSCKKAGATGDDQSDD